MHVSKPRSPPRIVHSGERFLVWTSKDIEVLRTHHRLVGAMVGALPGRKRQRGHRGRAAMGIGPSGWGSPADFERPLALPSTTASTRRTSAISSAEPIMTAPSRGRRASAATPTHNNTHTNRQDICMPIPRRKSCRSSAARTLSTRPAASRTKIRPPGIEPGTI